MPAPGTMMNFRPGASILAGLGVSALSRHTLNQPGQFAVLDVEGFPILRHWYAVYPAGRQLSVVARAFLDYLLGRGEAAAGESGKGEKMNSSD